MNCSEARIALGANPEVTDAAVAEHLHSCATCSAYAREMQQLERLLREAMSVPVPDIKLPAGAYAVDPAEHAGAAQRESGTAPATQTPTTPARQTPARARSTAMARFGRRFALAASVASVAVLAGLLWVGVPRESLATAVVEHMAGEPDAWDAATTLPRKTVAEVLSRSGVRLEPGRLDITYAHSCWFRGRHVPHLVVQTPSGPVTVVVLPREPVAGTVAFQEDGYQGVLVPAERGSIAVLTRDRADVDGVAKRVLTGIDYVD
jgi:hypothetical protein